MPETSYPKEKIKILLLENIHPDAIENFKKSGYKQLEIIPGAMEEAQLIKAIKGVHILGIRSKTKITSDVIAHADKLLAIGCFCIGVNQVDLKAASERGIAVFNSPYSNTRSVAELVIAESIMLMRRVPQKNQAAHRGIWLKEATGSNEVRGKTIGIIGYGHIGSQVSVLAEHLGMQVIFYDIEKKLALGNARQVDDLNKLLKSSDIITLHVPGTKETKNMLNKSRISHIKKGAVFLNLSRGDIVDLGALKNRLTDGSLKGAAIDVFPEEPVSKGDQFDCLLSGLDNVILTPHVGGSTMEAQESIGNDVASKLANYLESGFSIGSFTVPEISLPIQKGTHRLLHIHKNVPGILSMVNEIVSEMGINILAQYLNTRGDLGYVVLDIDKGKGKAALKKLNVIENTIKTRILY